MNSDPEINRTHDLYALPAEVRSQVGILISVYTRKTKRSEICITHST
jgi:hypothetical protein